MAACPSCRTDVDPGDRFCSSCGASLTTRSPRTEHRLITAVYVDLVGSTGLAEALDPENLTTVVRAVHDAVRAQIVDRGGTVGAFVGDGVLGVFGLPISHDDDPLRALRAALAIIEATSDIDATLGSRFDVDIDVRIGVNTGELLVPVSDDPDLGTLAGDVLNVAARLQEIAPSNSILVSEQTARSAPTFQFDDLGLLDVRGRARPVHGFEVITESEHSVGIRAPLHGRDEEHRSLQELYHRVAAEGRPHLVTVIGNAGVGKSRLVREFVDWALKTDAGLTSLSGRCLPYGEDITYRPLAEMLAALTGATGQSDPGSAYRAILESTTQFLGNDDAETATGALMRMIGLEPPSDTIAPAPRRTRELLRTTWARLISGIAADGPVMLLVEDIHWAGDALLDLLEYVVQRGTGPLLVVCPARTEITERHPEWGLDRSWSSTVSLEPLDADEASRLTAHLLADAGLPVARADQILERAGGNPFFIEELVRDMQLRHDDVTDPLAELPATIQAVLSSRIDLLDRTARRTLQAASVIGRIFWLSGIEAITGMSHDELEAILDRLVELQLVRVNPRSSRPDETEYIFQHVLIREAAYSRLSRRDLAQMHTAVAEWLAHAPGDTAESAERLAFHTWRAHDAASATGETTDSTVAELRGLAVERLVAAAAVARRRAAFGRSRQLAEIASATAATPTERAISQEQLGLTALAEYDGDAAWEALRSAVDRHLETEPPDHHAIATAAAAAVEAPLRWRGTIRQLPPAAETLQYLDIGLEHAGTDDSEALASLLTAVAFASTLPGPQGTAAREVVTIDEGRSAALRAREMAKRLGLAHVESAALDALQAHALWGGRIQEAVEIITQRLELVDTIDDPWEVGDTYGMAAGLAHDFGRYTLARDRALHGYTRTIDEAPSGALHNLSWAAVAHVQLGDWDAVAQALATARSLLGADRRDQPPHYAVPLFAAAAMVAEFRGKPDQADALLAVLDRVWTESDLADRGGHPHARWARHTGPIHLRRRDFETVERLVESDDAQPIRRESDRLSVLCDYLAVRRDWEAADAAIEETRSVASAYGLGVLVAHADRLEGRASLATRDTTGGLTLLAAARERFDSLGAHWEAAHTGLDIATAGGEIDLEDLQRFFEAVGSVDEIARVRALRGPGDER